MGTPSTFFLVTFLYISNTSNRCMWKKWQMNQTVEKVLHSKRWFSSSAEEQPRLVPHLKEWVHPRTAFHLLGHPEWASPTNNLCTAGHRPASVMRNWGLHCPAVGLIELGHKLALGQRGVFTCSFLRSWFDRRETDPYRSPSTIPWGTREGGLRNWTPQPTKGNPRGWVEWSVRAGGFYSHPRSPPRSPGMRLASGHSSGIPVPHKGDEGHLSHFSPKGRGIAQDIPVWPSGNTGTNDLSHRRVHSFLEKTGSHPASTSIH